jgi:hypothetical protein
VRGGLVRELATTRTATTATGSTYVTRRAGGTWDLSDPFVSEAGWIESGTNNPFASERDALRELLERVQRPSAGPGAGGAARARSDRSQSARPPSSQASRLSAAERLLLQAIESKTGASSRIREAPAPPQQPRHGTATRGTARRVPCDERRRLGAQGGQHDLTTAASSSCGPLSRCSRTATRHIT